MILFLKNINDTIIVRAFGPSIVKNTSFAKRLFTIEFLFYCNSRTILRGSVGQRNNFPLRTVVKQLEDIVATMG